MPQRYLNVTPETTQSNAIQNVNQSSNASSYALLCNENILGWTCGEPAERSDLELCRNLDDVSDAEEEEVKFVSFAADSINENETCHFQSVASTDLQLDPDDKKYFDYDTPRQGEIDYDIQSMDTLHSSIASQRSSNKLESP